MWPRLSPSPGSLQSAVCIEKKECDPAIVKHRASKGHDLAVVVVAVLYLGQEGVGMVRYPDLVFLQFSQLTAIVVPV